MSDQFESGCLWRRALRDDRSTGISGVVPLPELSETQRGACFRLCGIQTHGLCRYQRRNNQVQFVAR